MKRNSKGVGRVSKHGLAESSPHFSKKRSGKEWGSRSYLFKHGKLRISKLTLKEAVRFGVSKQKWQTSRKISRALKSYWAGKEKDYKVSIKVDYKKNKGKAGMHIEMTKFVKAASPEAAKEIAVGSIDGFLDLDVPGLIAVDMIQDGKDVWKVGAEKVKKEGRSFCRMRNRKEDDWSEYINGRKV